MAVESKLLLAGDWMPAVVTIAVIVKFVCSIMLHDVARLR